MATGHVCYCPELKLYTYRIVDRTQTEGQQEAVHRFDEYELEDAIATHLANDDEKSAGMMANMTGLARNFPHKFVTFDTSKEEGNIQPMEPAEYFKAEDARRS